MSDRDLPDPSATSDGLTADGPNSEGPLSPAEWDEMYDGDHLWSGAPNGALVAQVEGMAPATVLDVGCGEGADAVWLAQAGWQVTALDPSRVAIERGRRAAADVDVTVTFVAGTLLDIPGDLGTFHLVSAQYPAIPHDPAAIAALLAAVAPGGTLLFVHHVIGEDGHHDHEHAHPEHAHPEHGQHEHEQHEHGQHEHDEEGPSFDPADYVMPDDVADALDDGWEVEINEVRTRLVPTSGRGAAHVDDRILRARRVPR